MQNFFFFLSKGKSVIIFHYERTQNLVLQTVLCIEFKSDINTGNSTIHFTNVRREYARLTTLTTNTTTTMPLLPHSNLK